MTQLIETPQYTLYQGDCLDYMRGMEAGSVYVVTDPPYGIGESGAKNATRSNAAAVLDYGDYAWNTERKTEAIVVASELAVDAVIFGGNYYADVLPPSMGWAVWDKLNGKNDFADCEMIWTSYKRAARMFRYRWSGMIKEKPEMRYHPTQKPLDLMRWLIENYTPPASTVFDPFMGSGTTGVACAQLGRRFIGCEIDPGYFEIARKRIETAYRQTLLPLEGV